MKTAIVIPVYNESQNIEVIIRKINDVSKEFQIIIVDDDSKDGTKEILANLSKEFNISHHIRLNERGYGSALIFGFNLARNYDVIITIDADLSHDPSVIPQLIDSIKKGNDISIGSRYIPGGEIADWPLSRRLTSKLTNLFVSLTFNTRIKDNTSGYRAYSGSALNTILKKIKAKGYYVLEEILFWARQENLRIEEIPITFTDRKKGESKANIIKEGLGLLKLAIELRKETLRIFYRFLVVGFTGIFVNEGLLYILTELFGIYYLISSVVAIEVSIISNFILNDIWAFKDRRFGNFFVRLIKFNFARILTSSLNYITLVGLTYVGMNYLVANLIGIGLATFFGFAVSLGWIWKIEND